MKTSTLFIALCLLTGGTGALAETAPVGTVARAAKIGVYDSRAVSFAHFWSEAGANKRSKPSSVPLRSRCPKPRHSQIQGKCSGTNVQNIQTPGSSPVDRSPVSTTEGLGSTFTLSELADLCG